MTTRKGKTRREEWAGTEWVLSAEEEEALYHRMKAGDTEAAERLVKSVERWAIRCARRWRGHGLSQDDLDEIAYYAIVESLIRWDIERGRLTTVIPHNVKSQVIKQRALLRGVARISPRLTTNNPDASIRKRINPEYYEAAQRVYRPGRSLDAAMSRDSRDRLIDNVNDYSAVQPLAILIAAEEKSLLQARYRWALRQLTERERLIIRARIELGMTLQDIADRLGITKERVRQIEEVVKERLRYLFENASMPDLWDAPELDPVEFPTTEEELQAITPVSSDLQRAPIRRPELTQRIIQHLAEHPGADVQQLSRVTGCSPRTVHHCLYAAEGRRWQRVSRGCWALIPVPKNPSASVNQ